MKIVIIVLVSFLASLMALFSGFGLGTVLMPVIAIFFPIAVAIALTALVHLMNNLFKLGILWKFVNWPVSLKFGIPALLAAIPGALLLTKFSEYPAIKIYKIFEIHAELTPVGLTVGLLLIIFAFVEWFSMMKKWNISASYLPVGGLLSGFFGGVSGHQGAFRSAFLLHAGLDAKQFIATNAVIASLVDITRLIIYGINLTLLIEQVEVTLIAATTVAAFAGVLAGKLISNKITIDFIHKLVAILLLALGLLMAVGILT